MSSVVDICNLALSHLGDEARVVAIVPPDGSAQSTLCGRFYPMARDVLLEAHPWPFAVKRADLSEVDNPLDTDWSFAYELPSDCLRPLSALQPGVPERLFGGDTDAGTHPYIVEASTTGERVMYTNVDAGTVRYIARVEDPTRFTPSFVTALSRLLASYLAGPVLRGKDGRAEAATQLKLFDVEYRRATANAANTGRRNGYQTRSPSFIAARGAGISPLAAAGRITYEG